MNIATVFKQSTTTSARMSTNIHRTELSSLSSIRFDQLSRQKKISSGQAHQQQLAINKHQIKTTTNILMESNSVLNVRQQSDNEPHRQRQQRRHSLSVRDERLLKILSAPPDEPLYINGTPNTKSTSNGDSNSSSADNLLMQLEAATSSITAIDDYENENLPPTNDKNAVANIEGY